MQVGAASTSAIALLPAPVTPRRDEAVERAVERIQPVADQSQRSAQREVDRVRVRASAETQQANNRAQEVLRDLPARQRSALQTYMSNGPTIQERLGVDLAGIDVYA